MWPSSDYEGEMARLTSDEIEAILAGVDPEADEPAGARLAGLVRDLRRELLAEVPDEVAAGHLQAMAAAQTAEPATTTSRRSEVRLMTRKRVTLLGLAATLALGAGLATAVDLPDQASDRAQEVVGDLPIPGPTGTPGENGGADPAANDHGQAVSSLAQSDSLEGCEKGMAVSDLASSKADGVRQDDVDRPDPCAQGEAGEATGASARGSGGGGGSGGPDGGGGSGGGGSEVGSGGGGGSGGPGGGGGSGGGGSGHSSGGGSGGVSEDLPGTD